MIRPPTDPTNLESERDARGAVTGPGIMLRSWLVEGQDDLEDDVHVAEDLPSPTMPVFSSGVLELDVAVDLVGMTGLIGRSKLGKSFFAMSCAVASCRVGWQVIYLNCELPGGVLVQRLRDCAAYQTKVPEYLADGMWRSRTLRGYRTPLLIAEWIAEHVKLRSTRVLIVLDS